MVSHAGRLLAALDDEDCVVHALEKDLGETRVANRDLLERPPWRWIGR